MSAEVAPISEYYLNGDGDIDTLYIKQLEQVMRKERYLGPFTFNDVRTT